MRTTTSFVRPILATCLALCATPALAYDLAEDFSATDNPNGLWRYGSAPTDGSPPALFDNNATAPLEAGGDPVSYWNTGASSWDAYHGIFANLGAAPALVGDGLTVNPGEVVLHPSNQGASPCH